MSEAGGALKTGAFARHATWLELFYDLIYVVAIARLAHLVSQPHGHHLSLEAYLGFAALFVPVWWAWTGHAMFQNRFDPDDTGNRILSLLQMLATCVMAVFVADALHGGAVGFALSYFAVRALLVLMYWRVHRRGGDHIGVTRLFIAGFSLGALLWLVSAAVPAPYMFMLWAAGMIVDMATPWIGHRRLARASVHAAHLPERLGLLTIIVLGESVVSVVGGVESAGFGVTAIAATLAGFVLLGAIWWLYFESLENSLMGARYGNGQLAIYGHLPVYLGLVTVAAGVRHGITGELTGQETAWLLCGGMLLFLLPLQIIHGVRLGGARRRQFITTNSVLNGLLLALALFGGGLAPGWQLAAVAALYTAYVLYETPKYATAAEETEHTA